MNPNTPAFKPPLRVVRTLKPPQQPLIQQQPFQQVSSQPSAIKFTVKRINTPVVNTAPPPATAAVETPTLAQGYYVFLTGLHRLITNEELDTFVITSCGAHP